MVWPSCKGYLVYGWRNHSWIKFSSHWVLRAEEKSVSFKLGIYDCKFRKEVESCENLRHRRMFLYRRLPLNVFPCINWVINLKVHLSFQLAYLQSVLLKSAIVIAFFKASVRIRLCTLRRCHSGIYQPIKVFILRRVRQLRVTVHLMDFLTLFSLL